MTPSLRVLVTLICAFFVVPTAIQAHSLRSLEFPISATFVVFSDDPKPKFLGSAFALKLKDRTTLVTNAHVVEGKKTVVLKSHAGARFMVTVGKIDKRRDLAELSTPMKMQGLLTSDPPELGGEIFALGAPLGHEFTVTSGIISGLQVRLLAQVPIGFIRHDAAINPGSSGGPLVDAKGRVVGLNSQIADGSRLFAGISYAIPIGTVAAWLNGHLRPIPDLGLTARDVDFQIAEALQLERPQGALIEDTSDGGWAWQNGLRSGDVILGINEHEINSDFRIVDALDQRKSEVIKLKILRNGRTLERSVTLPRIKSETSNQRRDLKFHNLSEAGVLFDESAIVSMAGSKGRQTGLFEGDKIVAWNGVSIGPQNKENIGHRPMTDPVLLRVERDGRTLHVVVDPNQTATAKIFGGNVLDPAVISY